MNTIFYYTGILVWVLILLSMIYVVCCYTYCFWKRHVKPSLLNLKLWIFGKREFKGRYYEIWLRFYRGRYGVQKHYHSMKYFKRLAYNRFISEVLKERRQLHTITKKY